VGFFPEKIISAGFGSICTVRSICTNSGRLLRDPPIRVPHDRKGGVMDDFVSSTNGPIIPSQRERPPKDLTVKQQAIWRELVASVDRDWFGDTRPLLTELCAHVDYARMIAGAIETVRAKLAELELGSKEHKAMSRQLAGLLRAHGIQSSSIASLSTKLRLTPQSRQSARRADQVRARTGPRPWEWRGEHERDV